ncbi:MAG: type II toxin-antitoxin system RelE/ParE family toxin [Bacteroidetes bacterium]|nr:type II toxin-antitoxin system RelE/ParE family toxin [Bacteroidota bacterium]
MISRKVKLSPLAEQKLDLLLDYLEKEWSVEIRNRFLQKFKEKAGQAASFPKSCPESIAMPGIFKAVIDHQNSFFYRLESNGIEIITLTDNRSEPQDALEELKGAL